MADCHPFHSPCSPLARFTLVRGKALCCETLATFVKRWLEVRERQVVCLVGLQALACCLLQMLISEHEALP